MLRGSSSRNFVHDMDPRHSRRDDPATRRPGGARPWRLRGYRATNRGGGLAARRRPAASLARLCALPPHGHAFAPGTAAAAIRRHARPRRLRGYRATNRRGGLAARRRPAASLARLGALPPHGHAFAPGTAIAPQPPLPSGATPGRGTCAAIAPRPPRRPAAGPRRLRGCARPPAPCHQRQKTPAPGQTSGHEGSNAKPPTLSRSRARFLS
ncbi:hypothetical protein SAMN02799624_02075 [Paenibacillus sp. UNC496MF]|nr:hypothetical protein SAMN02799624_02075 [Paenibacillus sp. UNC496MF]